MDMLQWFEMGGLLTLSKSFENMNDDMGTDLYLIFIGIWALNNSDKIIPYNVYGMENKTVPNALKIDMIAIVT